MSGDRTTQLPLVNLADEIIVNRAGTTARILVKLLAAQFAQEASVSPTIASIAKLGTAAGKMLYSTAPDTWAETPITAVGRALLDDADVAAQRETLGLGTVTTFAEAVTDLSAITRSGWNRFAAPVTANAPFATGAGMVMTIFYDGSSAVQLVWGYNKGESDTGQWIRWRAFNVWGAWVRLYGSESEIRAFALGDKQTWRNVVGSRVSNTVYQNTTARPIFVSIRPNTAATGLLQVSADNVTWITIVSNGAVEYYQISAIVPPGHYYRATFTFSSWAELR